MRTRLGSLRQIDRGDGVPGGGHTILAPVHLLGVRGRHDDDEATS